MARKTNYDTLSQIEKRGPFDEYPIFPPGKDPQLCLSRNLGVQPFHLICEHDTVLAQLGGEGSRRVRGRGGSILRYAPGRFRLRAGGRAASPERRIRVDRLSL